MATLSALKFGTPDGADQVLMTFDGMQKQQLIDIQDAAIVTWQQGKSKPRTHPAHITPEAGALGGAFWGVLFGLLFFVPFFSKAVGAVMSGLISKFSDYGFNDRFIKQVQSSVVPGTSALFLITINAISDRVLDELKKMPAFEIIQTSLSKEQEEKLRAELSVG